MRVWRSTQAVCKARSHLVIESGLVDENLFTLNFSFFFLPERSKITNQREARKRRKVTMGKNGRNEQRTKDTEKNIYVYIV